MRCLDSLVPTTADLAELIAALAVVGIGVMVWMGMHG